jgi:Plasmid pRiA4b ORF-3-like protein
VDDVEAAADKAQLTGQIRSFMTWLGEGRKLTQTGRIGMTDARHLVELLGTGDEIDPEIGGRVFKTRSSEELASLTRIVEWMKAARLVRVTGTRLVPVRKNAHLVDRPLDLVLAMLEAYPRLGKSLFPRNTWRQSLVGDEFTFIGPELLTRLQAAMGWDDSHLHAFQIGKISYGPDPDGELGYADETKVRLADVARVRARIGYEYDFGDGWEHDLIVEARVVAEDGKIYPACIAGEGACPPEDSGGAYGFADLKEILAGPPTDERYEMQAWTGEDYDPGRFDLAAANAAVAAV